MTKKTSAPKILVIILLLFTVLAQFACKKDPLPTVPNTIEGLWEGTYKVGSDPSYYFSFSIYPNGTLSYKSQAFFGSIAYHAFADGMWTLDGTQFSFTVTTINIPTEDPQHVQSGTAVYDRANNALTNGSIADASTGDHAIWSMTKVK